MGEGELEVARPDFGPTSSLKVTLDPRTTLDLGARLPSLASRRGGLASRESGRARPGSRVVSSVLPDKGDPGSQVPSPCAQRRQPTSQTRHQRLERTRPFTLVLVSAGA